MMPHFDALPRLFEYRLGMALKMEHDSLNLLQILGGAAQSGDVRRLFAYHQDETLTHISNLRRAFELLGFEIEAQPSPATEAIMQDGMEMIARTDDALLDEVLLLTAMSVEHYEVAVYEGLVIAAHAIGADAVRRLLQQNLKQERRTSEDFAETARRVVVTVPGGRP